MILTVHLYNNLGDYHECVDEQNHTHRVDLLTDDSKVGTPQSLVGKKIEVEYLTPYIEIAHGVKVL